MERISERKSKIHSKFTPKFTPKFLEIHAPKFHTKVDTEKPPQNSSRNFKIHSVFFAPKLAPYSRQLCSFVSVMVSFVSIRAPGSKRGVSAPLPFWFWVSCADHFDVPGPLPNTSLEHALSHCGNGAAPRSPPQHESGACALPPSRYHFLGFRTPTHGGGICAAPKDQLSSDDSTIGPTYASTPTESRINFQFAHPFSRRHRQWNIQLRRPT